MTTYPPLDATTISAGELNRRTADVLDRVDSGETLAVTRHGVVVAVLGPARAHPLAGLVEAGLVTPANRSLFATEPHRR